MNKVLMISIRPEHAVNILNGKKTLELRTWIPKDYVGWVYVYCTKGTGRTKYHHLYNLTEYNNGKTLFSITHHNKYSLVPDDFLNGTIPFRFWFDEYDTLTYEDFWDRHDYIANAGEVGWEVDSEYIKLFCLDYQDILDYGFREKPHWHQVDLYAWHIKDLEIFDTPKHLSEFYVTNKGLTYKYIKEYEDYTNDEVSFRLKKAPQKMQYVYTKELENE